MAWEPIATLKPGTGKTLFTRLEIDPNESVEIEDMSGFTQVYGRIEPGGRFFIDQPVSGLVGADWTPTHWLDEKPVEKKMSLEEQVAADKAAADKAQADEEAEEQRKVEAEARAKAHQEAKEKAEAEAKEREEAEAKQKAKDEADAKTKAEADAKANAKPGSTTRA